MEEQQRWYALVLAEALVATREGPARAGPSAGREERRRVRRWGSR